jgi:hypothetical protein
VGGGAAGAASAVPVLLGAAAVAAGGTGLAAGVPGDTIEFTWADPAGAALLRFELRRDGGAAAAAAPASETSGEVLSAFVKPGVGRYAPPPWALAAERAHALRWRVASLGANGEELGASDWRALIRP